MNEYEMAVSCVNSIGPEDMKRPVYSNEPVDLISYGHRVFGIRFGELRNLGLDNYDLVSGRCKERGLWNPAFFNKACMFCDSSSVNLVSFGDGGKVSGFDQVGERGDNYAGGGERGVGGGSVGERGDNYAGVGESGVGGGSVGESGWGGVGERGIVGGSVGESGWGGVGRGALLLRNFFDGSIRCDYRPDDSIAVATTFSSTARWGKPFYATEDRCVFVDSLVSSLVENGVLNPYELEDFYFGFLPLSMFNPEFPVPKEYHRSVVEERLPREILKGGMVGDGVRRAGLLRRMFGG